MKWLKKLIYNSRIRKLARMICRARRLIRGIDRVLMFNGTPRQGRREYWRNFVNETIHKDPK